MKPRKTTELDRQQAVGVAEYAELRRKAELWDYFYQARPSLALLVEKAIYLEKKPK